MQLRHSDNTHMLDMPSSSSSYSTTTVINSVTAGYVAGIAGVVIGHPLDSAKVWLQTKGTTTTTTTATPNTSLSSTLTKGQRGVRPTAPVVATTTSATANMSTLAHQSVGVLSPPPQRGFNLRSIRALYSGLSGPLVTVGMIQSVNFAIYDSMRRTLYQGDLNYLNHDSLVNVTLSSMVAGSILAVFTSPLSVIKTKQQIMEWNFQRALLTTPRVKDFYVGFGPHCVAEIVGRGVYFTTYEYCKRTFRQQEDHNNNNNTSVSLPQRCVSAAVAGIVCWTIIFPFDALRNRMYAQSLSSSGDYKSSWEMAKSMYREQHSFKPFFRGFGVTVLRAGPVAAAVLPIYDTTLEWLSAGK